MDTRALVATLILAGALLIGALVVAFVRRWQRSDRPLGPSASDQLAQFRALYEEGAISEEEFKRLRGVLGVEIRQVNNLPAPPAPVSGAPRSPATPAANGEHKEPPPTGVQPG